MRQAIAIRHLAFEDLGLLGPLLADTGFSVRYLDAGLDPIDAAEVAAADLLIVLGGPIGAYEEEAYPFLAPEVRAIEMRLRADRPTLGICLGAQLMARALGARVYPGIAKEIGFAGLTLSDEGRRSCLRHLEGGPVLHWHGDTFDLPPGAVHLASTAVCRNQAFSHGTSLALQFHAEVDVRRLESWLIGHTVEIGSVPGLKVTDLRADGLRVADDLLARGRAAMQAWLDGLWPSAMLHRGRGT